MTTKLKLSLLGTVVMTLDGEPVSGQVPAKSLALLCYLAVTGQAYSREKLAGLLWGDTSETKANLRKALSALRQLLGETLLITRQTVALDQESDYWLDVEAFEFALAEDGRLTEEAALHMASLICGSTVTLEKERNDVGVWSLLFAFRPACDILRV